MMKWMLAAGAAALAMSSPALAEKGGHGGKGQGGQAAKVQKGGGNKAARGGGGGGNEAKQKGGGQKMQFAQQGETKQKGGGQAKVRSTDRGNQAVKIENRGGDRVHAARIDNVDKVKVSGKDREVRAVKIDRDNRRDIRAMKVDRDGDRDVRVVRVDRDFDGVRFVPRWDGNGLRRGFVDGCPPGLAKKGNGCLPPGQAKKIVGTRWNDAIRASTLGWPYRQWYRDDDRFFYRWDDDYIYRVRRDGGLIDALFPFANRDYYYYPMGASYPDYFNYYNVPYQYQSFYPDRDDRCHYRYGDGAIYCVDPDTQLINGIAALLTGTPMGIGQPLPPAYSVYNVPFAYRTTYYDTPNDWYRYNDGYIYRVDPTTQLITAIISAIV